MEIDLGVYIYIYILIYMYRYICMGSIIWMKSPDKDQLPCPIKFEVLSNWLD